MNAHPVLSFLSRAGLRSALAALAASAILWPAPGLAQWVATPLTEGSTNIRDLTDCDGLVFFSSLEDRVWRPAFYHPADRRAYGLEASADPRTLSDPGEYTRVGNTVFFVATHAGYGRELFKADMSNPSAPVVALVKDVGQGPYSSKPRALTALGSKLLFVADSDNSDQIGEELWITDGTGAGTVLVKDIAAGGADAAIGALSAIGGIAYFQAADRVSGLFRQWWRTDGTPTGTVKLYDRSGTTAPGSVDPRTFTEYHGAVYCTLDEFGSVGRSLSLWKTNGQPSGTVAVKSPVSSGGADGGGTPPDRIVVVNDLMIFRGSDPTRGYELWRSDGTDGGTGLLKDIDTRDKTSGEPQELTLYKGEVYFTAKDATHGRQIWKTDGTPEGTRMVHELPITTNPQGLFVFDEHLFFTALGTLGTTSVRLWWATDGSTLRPEPALGVYVQDADAVVVSSAGLFVFATHPSTSLQLFRVGPQLRFSLQPQSQLVPVGSAATFSAAAAGGVAVARSSQWKRDRSDIPGAVGTTYTLPSVTLADAASYTVVLSAGDRTAESDPARLGVVKTTLPPVHKPEGGTVTLAVQATAPVGTALTYVWRRGTTVLGNVLGRITGATTARLVIAEVTGADAGDYTCTVGLDALTLPTDPVNVTIVAKPVVEATAPPPAIISGFFSWQLAASGFPSKFTVTGLPRGLSFDAATGLIAGIPEVSGGDLKVKVFATNDAGPGVVREFTLPIGELPDGAVGTFTGLVARHAGLNASLGGTLTTTVAPTGRLSGSLKLGPGTYPFSGRLAASVSGDPTGTVVVKRGRATVATLNLTFNPAANTVTGTVVNGGASATFEAHRHVWTATSSATSYAGNYNVALRVAGGASGDLGVPQGHGWMQVAVTPDGRASIKGRSGDGVTFSCGASLWPDGTLPAFALLYASKGSILGLPRVTLGAAPAYADNTVGGSIDWQKNGPSRAADRTYRDGFGPSALTVDGSKWVRLPKGTIVLGLNDQADNARVSFSDALLSTASQSALLPELFRITTGNAAQFPAARTPANPCSLALSIKPASGLFSGSFILTDDNPQAGRSKIPRRVNYFGILLPHRGQGYGYFTLPGLTGNSPILSGKVAVSGP